MTQKKITKQLQKIVKKRKKTNSKTGRPSKFKKEYEEEALKLATLGINEEDIAWYFGVHPNSLANWKKRYPEFLWAIKKGTAHKKISLMKAMYENATINHNASVQIFLAKNWMGMSDKQEMALSGNVTVKVISAVPRPKKGKINNASR